MSRFQRLGQLVRANRGRIAIGLLLLVWIYFLGSFGQQAWRANKLQDEVAGQRQSIEQLEQENAELRQELQRMTSTEAYHDYVRGVARRDLGLALPDETVMLLRWQGERPPMKEPTPTPPDDGNEPNWQQWLDLFTGASSDR